jgi:predicted amidohydrolase
MAQRTIRVVLCQKKLGEPVTRNERLRIKDFRPDFVCFPEYFFVNKNLGSHSQTPHNFKLQQCRLRQLSGSMDTCVIGGTMPETGPGPEILYNTSYVYDRGELIGKYRKKNLFFAEVGKITPGDSYAVFESRGIRFGVMICADIFDDECLKFMKQNLASVIFSPTFSLVKDESPEEKFKRDNDIFVRAAVIAGAPIVKVCGVKSPYKTFLQARSLIASPEGVVYRVDPDQEHSELIIAREIMVEQ